MRATVDEDRCIGSGACVLEAPTVFDQREEDGVVVLLEPEVSAQDVAAVRRAARACPAAVIGLTGGAGPDSTAGDGQRG